MSALPNVQPDLPLMASIHGVGSFKEDIDIMSHPFLSVEKGRTTAMELVDQSGKVRKKIKVTGADYGIATVWDNDVLIYVRTLVASKHNRGEEVGRRIRFNAYDFLRATKRGTGKAQYEGLKGALQRLKATTIITNISADGLQLDQGVNWINDYTLVSRTLKNGQVVMAAVEIELSEWTWQMFCQVRRNLTIDQAYFEITGGLERKVYGIVKRHLGAQSNWLIGMDRLQELVGSAATPRKFRFNIRKMVEEQPIPGVVLSITTDYRLPDFANSSAPVPKGKREYLRADAVRPAKLVERS